MTQVTQVALVQSKQAMWDFDPTLATNRLAAGGLDVIAMIRTLAIKVCILCALCAALTTDVY